MGHSLFALCSAHCLQFEHSGDSTMQSSHTMCNCTSCAPSPGVGIVILWIYTFLSYLKQISLESNQLLNFCLPPRGSNPGPLYDYKNSTSFMMHKVPPVKHAQTLILNLSIISPISFKQKCLSNCHETLYMIIKSNTGNLHTHLFIVIRYS